MARDESLSDSEKAYEVNVHHQIVDTAVHKRFLTHDTPYADLSLLHPKNFPLIQTSVLPKSALEELSKCLVVYDSKATASWIEKLGTAMGQAVTITTGWQQNKNSWRGIRGSRGDGHSKQNLCLLQRVPPVLLQNPPPIQHPDTCIPPTWVGVQVFADPVNHSASLWMVIFNPLRQARFWRGCNGSKCTHARCGGGPK